MWRARWALLGPLMLAGCAGHASRPAPARAVITPHEPSSLDYVVYASMADAVRPLALASYRGGLAAGSEVAVQFN